MPNRTDVPYSPAAARNQAPILEHLRAFFDEPGRVLEVGSGTGQHALHFCAALPRLDWQPTDVPANIDSLRAALSAASASPPKSAATTDEPSRPREPIPWDVDTTFPAELCTPPFDYLYSANTFHIMSESSMWALIDALPSLLRQGGRFAYYGPFRYANRPLEPSNERFDDMLQSSNPSMGLRTHDAVVGRLADRGLQLVEDHSMPANNRLLFFEARFAKPAP